MLKRFGIQLATLVVVAAILAAVAAAKVVSHTNTSHRSSQPRAAGHCSRNRVRASTATRRTKKRVATSCRAQIARVRQHPKRRHPVPTTTVGHTMPVPTTTTTVSHTTTVPAPPTTTSVQPTPIPPVDPAPVPVPVPFPLTGPVHVETWAYDDCGNGGQGASSDLVRGWLSFAEANCGPGGDAKAVRDCHSGSRVLCSVIQYLDTNWIYQTGSPPYSAFSRAASESWYQHVSGSTSARVQTSGYGGGYLINQNDAGVQSFFQSYVRANYNGDDALMMDDQSPTPSMQLYYAACHCTASNEVGSAQALRSAHEAMSAAMTHADGSPFTQVDNTLPPNPYLPSGLDMLDHSHGVDGVVAEGEPESNGTLDPYYSTLLDQIAYTANETKGFVVPLSYAQAGASYQSQSRRVQEATMLLGYSPGHLVDWADLEQGSQNLAVWPEEGIYPTHPVQSMGTPGGAGCLTGSGQACASGGHNDVQVAPGVYRREFEACYDRGTLFGACATVINTTASPVTVQRSWLTGSYDHQITFTGGDVQSGGSVDHTGASFTAGNSTIPAHDATLLAG